MDGGVDLDQKGDKYGCEIQTIYNANDSLTLTLGGSSDTYNTDPYLFKKISDGQISRFSSYLSDYKTNEYALYLQADWKPLTELKLVGGLRYNDNSRSGDNTSPNFGIVYDMGNKKYLKFLYGQAFRSPNFFEQFVNTAGVLKGNPDLKAEKIDTYDTT